MKPARWQDTPESPIRVGDFIRPHSWPHLVYRVGWLNGEFASCYRVKSDGSRDRRQRAWSGNIAGFVRVVAEPGV